MRNQTKWSVRGIYPFSPHVYYGRIEYISCSRDLDEVARSDRSSATCAGFASSPAPYSGLSLPRWPLKRSRPLKSPPVALRPEPLVTRWRASRGPFSEFSVGNENARSGFASFFLQRWIFSSIFFSSGELSLDCTVATNQHRTPNAASKLCCACVLYGVPVRYTRIRTCCRKLRARFPLHFLPNRS